MKSKNVFLKSNLILAILSFTFLLLNQFATTMKYSRAETSVFSQDSSQETHFSQNYFIESESDLLIFESETETKLDFSLFSTLLETSRHAFDVNVKISNPSNYNTTKSKGSLFLYDLFCNWKLHIA